MASNFQEIATQFVPFYYQTFDTNREGLATLYRDTSMLTYESASVLGVAAIVDKLKVWLRTLSWLVMLRGGGRGARGRDIFLRFCACTCPGTKMVLDTRIRCWLFTDVVYAI